MREETLALFVSMLHEEGLTPGTMKSYLAAVRFGQISRGMGDPHIGKMPQLEYILKGVKRSTRKKVRPRLPITPEILGRLRRSWDRQSNVFDAKMLWAASCLCFFGFLRSGEIVSPTTKSHDPAYHLTVRDVSVDSREAPSRIQVQIKASKTDPFRQGIMLHIGRTDNCLCPVTAVLGYIVARGSSPGPLFRWEDGRFLTREAFVQAVRLALAGSGLIAGDYAGHSFRIGAATTAARQGLQDSLIKTLGRWESPAYESYIRTAPDTLSRVAKSLVASSNHS